MQSLKLILLVILISSCTKTVPVRVPLLCPDPLELPKIPQSLVSDAQMMSSDLQSFMVMRDSLQTARRETLQAICRSTHSGGQLNE